MWKEMEVDIWRNTCKIYNYIYNYIYIYTLYCTGIQDIIEQNT